MADDVFSDRWIATGDAVENLVETDFRPLRFAMLTTADEDLCFDQCRFINKDDIRLFGVGFKVQWLSSDSNLNKRVFHNRGSAPRTLGGATKEHFHAADTQHVSQKRLERG